MLGTRGIWENGWKAAALHAPISGAGHFDQDRWELFNVDEDRSEARDLAQENPDKLTALVDAWVEEAEANFVLPLDDRTAVELLTVEKPNPEPPRTRYVYQPGTAAVPEGVAANLRGRSYKIIADVTLTSDSHGVIFAHGSRFGGHALFIKDRRLYYVYNFLGIPPEQKYVSEPLQPGPHALGVAFTREKSGKYGESIGNLQMYVDDKVVAEGPMRAQVGNFSLCGDGLCVGYDSDDRVSQEYDGRNPFMDGEILGVGIDVGKEAYLDLEKLAVAAFARD
jgi:arylsulfatase